MGIPAGKYNTELVKRTKELLLNYDGTHNLTLLMNCLLSLIVLPHEFGKTSRLNFLDTEVDTIQVLRDIMSKPDFHFEPHNGKTFKNLLRRLRNGIAHQRIESISIDGKWIGVKVQDGASLDVIEFNIEFTMAELKTFCLYLADCYLHETENSKT